MAAQNLSSLLSDLIDDLNGHRKQLVGLVADYNKSLQKMKKSLEDLEDNVMEYRRQILDEEIPQNSPLPDEVKRKVQASSNLRKQQEKVETKLQREIVEFDKGFTKLVQNAR